MSETRATVLVVDDEPAVVDGHAARLAGRYEVRRAYDGSQALDHLDESVDVVLLDRRMPGLSGDDVLSYVRERDLDCRVAMLTGVDPGLDVVGMGFDDYLTKPVEEEELIETVERMLTRAQYDARLQEFFSLATRIGVLEAEHDREELMADAEYAALVERRDVLHRELQETVADLPQLDAYAVAVDSPATPDGASSS